MFGSLRSSLARCATLLTIFTVLALANPFCCHLLPHFAAEQAQAEVAFDGMDQKCPGKPDAQRECVLKVGEPLPAELWHRAIVVPIGLLERSAAPRGARPAVPPPLARHRLLGIYLV